MSEFERLREILLQPEHGELEQLQAQLRELEQAQRNTYQRLPQELIRRLREDRGPISDALVKPWSHALGEAVRQEPQRVIAALFPVIGPAIRRAIAEAMRDVLGNLNQVMESSLTPKGLRWRVEAWRSGVPYAQIALRHAMRFHIDHVFLIEPGSGLVLQHAAAPGLPEIDADAVAGMLSAINDFVHDSVAREGGGALNSATVGEHVLWLIEGPQANLASFIRGAPPRTLQTLLTERLEQWHERERGDNVEDAAQFAARFAIPELEKTAAANDEAPATPSNNWPLKLAVLALVLGIGVYWWRAAHWNQRIETLRTRLAVHPGFVLTALESSPYRSLQVHGLLDPIAAPLQADIDAAALGPVAVTFDLQPFVSAAPPLALQRAQKLLQPPSTIAMALQRGVLLLSGEAAPAWLTEARVRALWIAGIDAVDSTAVHAPDDSAAVRAELDRVVRDIGAVRVHLMLARTEPDPAYPGELDALLGKLNSARSLAARLHLTLQVNVYGLTDVLGEDTLNRALRERRAAWLLQQLAAAGIDAASLHAAPAPDGLPPAQQAMRAAAVYVTLEAPAHG